MSGLREVETSQLLYISDAVTLGFNSSLRINFWLSNLPSLFSGYFYLSIPQEFRLASYPYLWISSVFYYRHLSDTNAHVFSQYLVYFQYFAFNCFSLRIVFPIYSPANRRRLGEPFNGG